MAQNIHTLYDTRDGGTLVAEQCAMINKDLANLDPIEVPQDQLDNVLSYLDRQFLYQQVAPELASRLEAMIEALRARAS